MKLLTEDTGERAIVQLILGGPGQPQGLPRKAAGLEPFWAGLDGFQLIWNRSGPFSAILSSFSHVGTPRGSPASAFCAVLDRFKPFWTVLGLSQAILGRFGLFSAGSSLLGTPGGTPR